MKILHLLSQRPDSTGSGITLQAFVREAAARGHESALVAGLPAGDTPTLSGLPAERCHWIRFDGVDLPHPIVGMSDVMPYPSARFRDLGAAELERYQAVFAQRIDQACRRFAPDLVHSHHLWIMSAVARRTCPRLPLVVSCHGSDLRQLQSCPALRPLVVDGCREADRVLALSEVQRQEIQSLYGIEGARIDAVGAGFRSDLFQPGDKPVPPPVELVYAGKLSRAKGVVSLLRALAQIEPLPWRLQLVGSAGGDEAAEVSQLAARLGERVELCGALSQAELAARLQRAHLFVLPSFYEGLALVLLEALACGCRLVASDLPGPRSAFADLDARYATWVALPRLEQVDRPLATDLPGFEARLVAAIGARVEEVLERPGLDLGAARPLLERYTWGGVFARVEQAYARSRQGRGEPV